MRKLITLALIGCGAAALGAAGLTALDACVPADNRPPPGTINVTVSPSPAVQTGFTTVDGWSVRFDRVLVAIGRASMSDQCAIYSDADYDRILDVTKTPNQKLSILHGIGQCDFRFRIQAPTTDALLGDGVTEDDKTRLRTPGGDMYVPLGGVALEISGAATRKGVTKHFQISFRPRVRYGSCKLMPDSGSGVDIGSADDQTFDIRIEGEAMMRDDVDAAISSLRFEPFAMADKNGDGNVTLEELMEVPIGEVRDGGAFEAGTYDFDDDAGMFVRGRPIPITSFGDYVYELLLPSLPRFRDVGTCTIGIQRPRGQGGPG
jgi:hypothetical protein